MVLARWDTTREMLEADEFLDERLEELALLAQSLPVGSVEWQKALAQLVKAIQNSGRLVRPRKGQFKGFYDDIYLDAQQRLFLHICERIEDFDPKRGTVMEWVNFLFGRRFFVAASHEYFPVMPTGLDPRSVVRLSIYEVEQYQPLTPHLQDTVMNGQVVREFLSSDPQGVFCKTHVVGCPGANFQRIAIQRLDGFSWQEISDQLGVPIPTLSSFYQRALEKLGPMLREYLAS